MQMARATALVFAAALRRIQEVQAQMDLHPRWDAACCCCCCCGGGGGAAVPDLHVCLHCSLVCAGLGCMEPLDMHMTCCNPLAAAAFCFPMGVVLGGTHACASSCSAMNAV
jgi:hypothetical protein